MASDLAGREDHFQKKLSKTDLPFKFCKIGLKNTLFIFGRKNGRLFCFVVVVCCNFVRFWLTFFLIEALIELRKMLIRKKLFNITVWELLNP